MRAGRLPAIGAIATAVLAAACGTSDAPTASEPEPGHVHALGVNPADRSLFIATHTGLFRLAPEAERAERVGDRYQDTMGFTVVGPDHFLGSGHPDLRDDLPPLLGLIESRDGGETWTSVSLLGQVDFHALRVRSPRVVGYDATSGEVLTSGDRGRTWRRRRPPEPLVDLAVDPSSADVLLAAGEHRLFVSRDAGQTWAVREQATGLLAWPQEARLYLVDGNGRVWFSPDGGRRWQGRGEIGGRPSALVAHGEGLLYAATHAGQIKQSTDGGATWATLGEL